MIPSSWPNGCPSSLPVETWLLDGLAHDSLYDPGVDDTNQFIYVQPPGETCPDMFVNITEYPSYSAARTAPSHMQH
jgi:hypothetical protein